MKKILIIGAGRSATALIQYTLKEAEKNGWFVTVADADPEQAEKKVNGHPNGRATWLDVNKTNDRREELTKVDVVVSLLPAHLHILVAKDCIQLKKHLITASYVSKEMYKLGEAARSNNLIFMGEMGLDPGIDHMSAMQTIHEIREKGGDIQAFRSYTGGLIAPESDNNPWHYKFTWNPRNVVQAGQGTAQYLEDGKYKYIPYNRLFGESHLVDIPGMGEYDAYANRDSLLYRSIYGLDDIPNILRATLRYKGFCGAWHALVQLGLTDSSYPIVESDQMTYFDLVEAYLGSNYKGGTIRDRVANFLGVEVFSDVMDKLEWLGLFRKKKIKAKNATPATILLELLLDKWKLSPEDKDMIIMHHEFEYLMDGKKKLRTSTMILKGEDSVDTAMSRLVGLPLGIFVKLVMQGKIKAKGVQIPVRSEIYEPVLKELEDYGVVFKEVEKDI